ncbi:MAG: hypothetical protein ACOX87_05890 [Chloroflexota bacterium]
MTKIVAWYLSREYGDSVEVNYNDLSQAAVREKNPDIMEKMRSGELVLPSVFVDNKLVSLGSVDYFTITKAIRQSRENVAGEP